MRESMKADRLRAEAKRAMWMYYKAHKAALPGWIHEYRDEIILEIQSGTDPATVYKSIIDGAEADVAPLQVA